MGWERNAAKSRLMWFSTGGVLSWDWGATRIKTISSPLRNYLVKSYQGTPSIYWKTTPLQLHWWKNKISHGLRLPSRRTKLKPSQKRKRKTKTLKLESWTWWRRCTSKETRIWRGPLLRPGLRPMTRRERSLTFQTDTISSIKNDCD